MRRRKDGLCHKCNAPGTSVDGYCEAHAGDRPRSPITLRVDMADPHKTLADIVGELLTEQQLSDIVMAHCQPAIDAGTQTPLQRALHTAVVNFGRFE